MQSSPGGRAQVIDAHTKVNKETGHLGYNYLNGPPNQTRLLACPATAASLATTSLSTAVCLGRLFSPEEITPGLRSSLVRRGQSVPQVLCRVDAPWQRAPGLTGGGLPVTPSNISHSAPHSRRALRTSTSPADLKTLKRTAQNDAAIGRLEAHDSREGETKSNKHTTERPDAKHTKAISGSPKKKKITELQPTLSVSVQISLKEEVLALRQARGVQSGTLRRQACRTLPRYYTRTIYP